MTEITDHLNPESHGIEVREVNKEFGDFQALKDVNLIVPDGSMTALLGPSGSGKSTLLRTIAGLEVPTSGQVFIGGEDQARKPVRTRNVGFVFQHYAAFKHMTVFDNIAFGLKVRKWDKQKTRDRVNELIDLVQLTGLAKRYPSQLSGGQRQRMALARALAVEPSVLLLDEPFGALDAKVRKDLRQWLRRLHDEVHVTTIFVTHDQEEAMDIAEQIVVMNNGQIEQTGSATDLYDLPENEFVMGFVGEVNSLGGRLVRPHDTEILPEPTEDTTEVEIDRVVRLGFSGRVEMLTVPDKKEVWAQLTRSELETLSLEAGTRAYVRPRAEAVTKEDTGALEEALREESPATDTPIPAEPALPV
ncbi:MAG TPA: sulfate ABC transporter ATP-binding protein [Solirubrobacterales bacterium]|nr:sulfate ABC transporter ATP-binding protein [Solirubrobacterales bacterium]HNC05991.1 sulfate ABC transporter ATP-binding protein [Solirubrobacterales bacterium]